MSARRPRAQLGDLFWRQLERELDVALAPFQDLEITDAVRLAAIDAATKATIALQRRALPRSIRGTPKQIRRAMTKAIDQVLGRAPSLGVIEH